MHASIAASFGKMVETTVKSGLRKLVGLMQSLLFYFRRLSRKVYGSEVLRPPSDRAAFFAPVAAGSMSILEIGPLHTPICRRPHCNVEYIDVFSTAQLKKIYASDPHVPTESIVEVDHVWTNQSYLDLVGKTVDAVVSSHNIEHTPCLLQFLLNLEGCLNKSGAVYLAIPDKRYCFDHFKSESSLEEVILAYYDKRARHSASALLAQQLLVTHNDGWKHWLGHHGQPAFVSEDVPAGGWIKKIGDEIKAYAHCASYVDTHAWIFTPTSFARLISSLQSLGFTSLRAEVVHETAFGSHEFYALLRKA